MSKKKVLQDPLIGKTILLTPLQAKKLKKALKRSQKINSQLPKKIK